MTVDNKTAQLAARRIAKARTRLLLDKRFVFWATCALHLRPVAMEGMLAQAGGYIGTDGKYLFYDPAFIAGDKWSDDELMGVIAHEVSHATKGDPWRGGKRDRKLWNVACDARIDPELIRHGLTLPPHGDDVAASAAIFQNPANFGRAAEDIYNSFPPGGAASQSLPGDGMAGDIREPGSGDPGDSNADGNGQQQSLTPQQRQQLVEELSKKWEIVTRQAAQIAKAQGHLPAGMEHLIEPVRPNLDPYAMLRHFVSMCRKDDYSWARGNRRHAWCGLYLPSLYSEGIGEIIISVDMSGSTSHVWPKFVGFLNSVLNEVKPEKTWFIEWDAAVQRVSEFSNGEQLPTEGVTIKGGGGTSCRPSWEWIAEHNIQPVCCIVLTDLDMSVYDMGDDPGFPCLWVSTTAGAVGPFGETVEMLR